MSERLRHTRVLGNTSEPLSAMPCLGNQRQIPNSRGASHNPTRRQNFRLFKCNFVLDTIKRRCSVTRKKKESGKNVMIVVKGPKAQRRVSVSMLKP